MSDTTSNTDMPEGALKLPSGGWVQILPEEHCTGRHRRMVREAMDRDGLGSMLNAAYAKALGARVEAWDLPYAPNLPLPSAGAQILDVVRDPDLRAMEEAVKDWALDVAGMQQRKAKPEADGGTPPEPEGA